MGKINKAEMSRAEPKRRNSKVKANCRDPVRARPRDCGRAGEGRHEPPGLRPTKGLHRPEGKSATVTVTVGVSRSCPSCGTAAGSAQKSARAHTELQAPVWYPRGFIGMLLPRFSPRGKEAQPGGASPSVSTG